MSNRFTYSILKYRHSQLSGESLNVGVIFAFEKQDKYYFVPGNANRVKSAYPEFDPGFFNLITKHIHNTVATRVSAGLFPENYTLKEYIAIALLPEDSSAFQFSEVFTAVNVFGTENEAIRELSRVLLPDSPPLKEDHRHDEAFILKKYTEQISRRNINVHLRMRKDYPVHIKGVKLNFEYSWKNGTTHLVKPLSFDLKVGGDIINKSVTYFGYFDLLADYARRQDYNFDLLISRPQDERLQDSYEEAIFNLNQTKAPKSIITEDQLDAYSEETAKILHSKDL